MAKIQELPKELKQYRKAHQALKQFILEIWPVPEEEKAKLDVSVYCNGIVDGIRIQEIALFEKTEEGGVLGASYMRGDAGAIICPAEDFLIHHDVPPYRPEGWTSDIDLFAEAKETLQGEILGDRRPSTSWITAKVPPPDNCDYLLCLVNNSDPNSRCIATGYFDDEDKQWYLDNTSGGGLVSAYDCQVSHWCPLPQYPALPSA